MRPGRPARPGRFRATSACERACSAHWRMAWACRAWLACGFAGRLGLRLHIQPGAFQQVVARRQRLIGCELHQRFVHQPGEGLQRVPGAHGVGVGGHVLCQLQREAAAKHRQPAQHRLLGGAQQAVAPVQAPPEGCGDAWLPRRWSVTRRRRRSSRRCSTPSRPSNGRRAAAISMASGNAVELAGTVRSPGRSARAGSESAGRRPGHGPAAAPSRRCARPAPPAPCQRGRNGQRRQADHLLLRQFQRLLRGEQPAHTQAAAVQRLHQGGGIGHQVLAVVQHQQHVQRGQAPAQRRPTGRARGSAASPVPGRRVAPGLGLGSARRLRSTTRHRRGGLRPAPVAASWRASAVLPMPAGPTRLTTCACCSQCVEVGEFALAAQQGRHPRRQVARRGSGLARVGACGDLIARLGQGPLRMAQRPARGRAAPTASAARRRRHAPAGRSGSHAREWWKSPHGPSTLRSAEMCTGRLPSSTSWSGQMASSKRVLAHHLAGMRQQHTQHLGGAARHGQHLLGTGVALHQAPAAGLPDPGSDLPEGIVLRNGVGVVRVGHGRVMAGRGGPERAGHRFGPAQGQGGGGAPTLAAVAPSPIGFQAIKP